jgi:DNA (cytosine-5)-methyltransferase 1
VTRRGGHSAEAGRGLVFAGVFSGIGGFELGLARAGHTTGLLIENNDRARIVLETRFPEIPMLDDVREVEEVPHGVNALVAGFPCQDLSSVGQKVGIKGTRSRLVGEVFRLLERRRLDWVILENVPFLLQLGKGRALRLITSALQELGYTWAYRVVDSQAFGLPQRRRRWFLVASLKADPREVLLAGDVAPPPDAPHAEVACGFYWTEGMRALGWAVDAVPPIKGGSTMGVPSPPAIRLPGGVIVTPDIRDAERLQGFPANWTSPAERIARPGFRWQLVGNAVSVPVAEWLGSRLRRPEKYDPSDDIRLRATDSWPKAAWALEDGQVHASSAATSPIWAERPSLEAFLRFPLRPLSVRAASGFLGRTSKGTLRFPERFLDEVAGHIAMLEEDAA